MPQSTHYSSLPLVTAISGAITLCAVGGWFILGGNVTTQAGDVGEAAPLVLAIAVSAPPAIEAKIDLKAELRKARLATDADFIVSPPRRNALFYYGRVLQVDSRHPIANAEMDALLARISLIVNDYLAAGEFDEAYRLALRVAEQKPEHALVESMQNALNDYAVDLVEQARENIDTGNYDDAATDLTTLKGLPGISAEFVATSIESIGALRETRLAEDEKSENEKDRLAAEQAVSDWAQKVRTAIEGGQLILPEGKNARAFLAERDVPAALKDQLTDELLDAAVSASRISLENGALVDVESYLSLINELSPAIEVEHEMAGDDAAKKSDEEKTDDGEVAVEALVAENSESDAVPAEEPDDGSALLKVRDSIERDLIAAEGKRLLGLGDFVRLNMVPAKYPNRAHKRNLTGWVDVEFTVTANGETANIKVVEADPERIFDGSVIAAVQQWTFQPREYRGQPIDQRTAARLVFKLE